MTPRTPDLLISPLHFGVNIRKEVIEKWTKSLVLAIESPYLAHRTNQRHIYETQALS